MKRVTNLFHDICNTENLRQADKKARKGKGEQYGIRMHDKNREGNILLLQEMLINKTFRTSAYTTFNIYEPKERIVFRLPYFPDRIAHHAIMNIIGTVFTAVFTTDSYSCIKGKGIHGAAKAVKNALRDTDNTAYCLKLDIRKFYPSIDHSTLKRLLQRKFKDQNLLDLLFGIIDSADGLPIGNYLSQFLANFYLTGFDHWIKEKKRVRYYFRYADDIVILAPTKQELHILLAEIKAYLSEKLLLIVKSNHQIFPVDSRGIDFVGYVFFHGYTRLRKTIKKSFGKMMAMGRNDASFASYNGWAIHADCRHLLKKLTA